MRRTVLSATALACAAVLAGTVPAFADGASPVPSPRESVTASPAPAESTAPGAEPTRAPAEGQVSVVPREAPDTGVAPAQDGSGAQTGLIGGAAAAVFAAGGAVFLVRRRRATGA
jgi:hypothetical protein